MAKQNRSAPNGKPITSHQLFPAIIALWFGALFGLGSLAIRPGLIESLVISSHIDSIIPATAPPLGLTARILLALTLAALGALLGAAIGRRIARPKVEVRQRRRGATPIDDTVKLRTRDAHPDAPARRPISAHDEIGEGSAAIAGPDNQYAIAGRRRSLAIAEDDDRAVFHDFAPLPGGSPQILEITEVAFEEADEPETPLDLGDFASDQPGESFASPVGERQIFQPNPVANAELACQIAPAQDYRQVSGLPATETTAALAKFEPVAPFQPAQVENLESLDMVSLAERLGQSMQRRRERASAAIAAALPSSAPQAAPFESAPEVGDETSFAGLGLQFTAQPEKIDFEAYAAPDESSAPPQTIVPLAEVPPALKTMPAALRPISLEYGQDEDQEDYHRLLPPRMISMPTPSPEVQVDIAQIDMANAKDLALANVNEVMDESDEAIDEDDGYSSLLNLSRAASPRQSFVRIEDEPAASETAIEPVVIFPGQAARVAATAPVAEAETGEEATSAAAPTSFRRFDAPATAGYGQQVAADEALTAQDPQETEMALRAALASLQRMSGAA